MTPEEIKGLKALIKKVPYYFSLAQEEKALAYLKAGRIKILESDPEGLTAQAKGSASRPYIVTMALQKDSQPDYASGSCTCPASGDCVHVLAAGVLKQWQQSLEPDFSQRILKNLIPEQTVKEWSIPNLPVEKEVEAETSTPENAQFTLMFQIRTQRADYPQAPESVVLAPLLRYRKKDGSLGRWEEFNRKKSWALEEPELTELARWFSERNWAPLPWDLVSREMPELWQGGVLGSALIPLRLVKEPQIRCRSSLLLKSLEYNHPEFELEWMISGNGIDEEKADFWCWSSGELWVFSPSLAASFPLSAKDWDRVSPWFNRRKLTSDILLQLSRDNLLQETLGIEFRFQLQKIVLKDPDYQPALSLKASGKMMQVSVYGWPLDISDSTSVPLTGDSGILSLTAPLEKFLERFGGQIADQFRVWGLRVQQFHSSFSGLSRVWMVDMAIKDFLLTYGKKLMEAGVGLSLQGGLPLRKPTKVSSRVSSGIDWFQVEISSEDDGLIQEGRRTFLGGGWVEAGGRFYLLEESSEEQLKKVLSLGWKSGGDYRISKLNFNLVEQLFQQSEMDEDVQAWLKTGRMLRNAETLPPRSLPMGFKGTLRDYQKTGYSWLRLLADHDLNGCLADDMGLGKTVQTLAFILGLIEAKKEGRPFMALLVTPVSTLPNWEREIERFAPGVAKVRHHGLTRTKSKEEWPQSGLILVSYATLRQDLELFTDMVWDLVVLDEAQAIKNSGSQTFKSVKLLKTSRRLTLTGTPVENRMEELWSQMDFLNPGLLGTQHAFRSTYGDHIPLLRDTVYPFILRRKKQDVLKDLPDKEEVLFPCEMEDKQEKFYRKLALKYKREMEEFLAGDPANPSFFILQALLRLRQACLYPDLTGEMAKNLPSAKENALMEILEELREEDHKVLVFSQFTEVLQRIKSRLTGEKIRHYYLDGQTKDRDKVVEDFQKSPDFSVFLLSLKAGGVGINLTSADYVVLFDPWWNPAVESQAMDRAHRIGQNRKVTVYKLTTTGTIEDKILQLQGQKKELVHSLIAEDGMRLKDFSKAEILELFN